VRNRTLDFALALWKEQPAAGERAGGTSERIEASRVTQIFNTVVYGGSAQLVGTATGSTVSVTIGAKDFSSLERVLRENGVADLDIAELRVAVDAEPELAPNKGGFGPKVASWIAQMMRKAAEGSWGAGVGAAGTLLAQALAKYYGL
jgi:hypothetical protein